VDLQKLAELLLAGGLAGLIGAMAMTWKTRRDDLRDDRKQKADESTGAATVAQTLTNAAASIVKLQDEQVAEFTQQIRALQAESSAMNTRLDIEIQKRLRAEAQVGSIEWQIQVLREQLSGVNAKFELADQERIALKRENAAMKAKLFEMSVGVQGLMRQAREAGLAPVYVMDVPAIDADSITGNLGPLDMGAVRAAG
jgi:chromosome segregation ATPase